MAPASSVADPSSIPTPLGTADRALWSAFRRYGHLEATLDPLGRLPAVRHPDLGAVESGADPGELARARAAYCGAIGIELAQIDDPERRAWLEQRMESPAPQVDRERLVDELVAA